MSNTVAIIQARMGSTRLPGKVLMDIGEHPMLWHVVTRTRRAATLDDVVVATSEHEQDDDVAEFCSDFGVPCYRGSESDVLDRYYQTANEYDADTVVRVTADCPLHSPPVIDRVVRRYGESDADYVTNIIEYTHPQGLDVEVFDFDALETAWEDADAADEREHVTLYIRESGNFETENVTNVVDVSSYSYADEDAVLRWTVDYPEDMEFVRQVHEELTESGEWLYDQISILELLERKPELVEINER
ncbi:cytidylyltransferase domain-containing protein [Haloarchaeobius sp. DFWS5]|uniref:cytidylyltransferase domain-containing protein n=1 Tax=Haloarchaeobius sp. DFWS5 TaxID=3446114 RepID=UPI003EBBA3BC